MSFGSSVFDQKKGEWFPEIEDFSDSQDELRNTPGHKLSLGSWFWFNPLAFRLMMVWGFGLGTLTNFLLSAYCVWTGRIILSIVSIVLFLCVGNMFAKHVRMRDLWIKQRTNMFDQFLREYK